MTAGLPAGDLIIIAGRPCMGKTQFALNVAENAAIPREQRPTAVPVAVFWLEMSKEQLAQRLLCSQSEVPLHKVRSGYLANEDWPRLTTAAGLLHEAPIFIDDSPALTVLEIRAKCRRLKAEDRLGLLVIDYLQLIRPAARPRTACRRSRRSRRASRPRQGAQRADHRAVAAVARGRDPRQDRRPQLSDLRESGAIEQDADLVMFVFREVVYKRDTTEPNKAQIMIAKQRNGPTGDVNLTFLRDCTKFVPYSPMMPGETEPGVLSEVALVRSGARLFTGPHRRRIRAEAGRVDADGRRHGSRRAGTDAAVAAGRRADARDRRRLAAW